MSSFRGDSAPSSSQTGRRCWKPAVPGARRLTRSLLVEPLEERTVLAAVVSALDLPESLVVDTRHYDSSRILVRWQAETAPPAMSPAAEAAIESVRPLNAKVWEIALSCETTVEAALTSFRSHPLVAYAEPDYTLRAAVVPGDPQFSSLWGLNNTGQTGGTADADMDLPEAWDLTTGSSSTIVAVIDTGVDYRHPDLAANIWTNFGEIPGDHIDNDQNGFVDDVHGYDFINDDGDPLDDQGHGTHVAGTIGAVANNGIGVAGVSWNVRVMALKFLGADGSGSTSDAIRALNYAVQMGARISNNSYGDSEFSQAFSDALAAARQADHVFIAAAGNNSGNNDASPFYPASHDAANLISVAATDHNDRPASFTNYGRTTVDLAAPGVNIFSTTPNNTYSSFSGTSMAAPHVAGVAALVRGMHPAWTYQQTIDRLLTAVDYVPALENLTVTGGRLNAAAAVGVPDTSGPRVVAVDPTGATGGPVSSIRVSFHEPIDLTTFTVADIVSFVGPSGNIAVTGVQVVAGSLDRKFDITFVPQFAKGAYELLLGPAVIDRAGNFMNQDADAINGEVPADQFVVSFVIGDVQVFRSTDVPLSFFPFSTSRSTLTIDQGFSIADLDVQLDISYAEAGLLALTLISPTGIRVPLAGTTTFNGANFQDTTFDDEAGLPITAGNPPYIGAYQPISPLAALDGTTAQGEWNLEVGNPWFHAGTLRSWSLRLVAHPPRLSADDVAIVEGNSGITSATFTVLLSNAISETVTVNYATEDGAATAGSDYDAASGQLTFVLGELTKTITVAIHGDTLDEPDENFFLRFSDPTNATLAVSESLGKILNDEARLSISDVSLVEGNSGTASALFAVTLDAPSNQVVTVDYALAGATATSGSDFVPAAGTLTFLPGQTAKTIAIDIKGDMQNELTETFFVNLQNSANAFIDSSQGVGTITNDDPVPAFTISDARSTEGNGGTKTFAFYVNLSAASGRVVTIDYVALSGSAQSGSDFTATSGTLTFNAGQTGKTIVVAISGDAQAESDETFVVQLSNPSGGVLLDAEGLGTIQNDDTSLLISDAALIAGDSGLVEAVFTVSLSAAASFEVGVNYGTANGTAASGSDYVATSGTLRFTPGQISQTVRVLVLGDPRDEADETFFVNLSGPTSALIVDSQGIVTIADDDPLPHLSISDASVVEGNSGTRNLNFTVSLSEVSGRNVTVQYATANGTASAGGDYLARSGTLTIFAGALSQTISVTIHGDTLAEPNETLLLTLTNPANVILDNSQTEGTIVDEDNLSISDPVLVETDEGLFHSVFTIGLAVPLAHEVRVDYATANGTAAAGSDYLTTAGALVLGPGETSQTVSVPVLGDRLNEADEAFFLNLTRPVGIVLSDTQALASITDDDPLPHLTLSDATIAEGNSGTRNLTFTVSLSAISGRAVSVQYSTADGTATAGSDYLAKSGTLTLYPGALFQTISVTVTGDTAVETSETVALNLLSASNAVLDIDQAIGTIATDDPLLAISVGDAKVTEGNTGTRGISFTVSLSAPATQAISVAYATASGSAESGNDFAAGSGTLTFSPGQTSKSVVVVAAGDTQAEPDETFLLQLSNPSGGVLLDADGLGTIQNDDTSLRISDSALIAGDSGLVEAVFTVSLSAAASFEVGVDYATANGTAVSGSDYVATYGTLRFSPGEFSQMVRVLILGDPRDEADEWFSVNLTSPTSALIADSQGVVTIADDDPLPHLSISDATVVEGNAGTRNLNFTVSLSAVSGRNVTVQYATANGTAGAGSDYVARSGTLTLFAGGLSQTISVPINGDTQAEPDETLLVTLTSPVNVILDNNQAEGTILDEDNLSISDPVLVETDDGLLHAVFTIGLAIPLAHEVRVDYATANGTAAAGSDYLTTAGTLVLTPGETSRTVSVPVLGDRLNEADEAFFLNLTRPVGLLLSDTQAVASITDDDPLPSLRVSDVMIAEGNSGTRNLTFAVSLSAVSGRAITVEYATADGTATAGSDYLARSGTLTFYPGWVTQTITVTVNGDAAPETPETVLLNLFSAANAILDVSLGTGLIVDDDQELEGNG